MTETIFKTVHGSRLYGFDHSASDHDSYVVTTSTRSRPRQSVRGESDVVRVGWDTFLRYATGGSHQSAEALFSPFKEWEGREEWRPFIENMRIGGGEVCAKYERTIRAFCFGDFKRRRHAVRLASNLADIRRHGRFNPSCGDALRSRSHELAASREGESLWSRIMGRE